MQSGHRSPHGRQLLLELPDDPAKWPARTHQQFSVKYGSTVGPQANKGSAFAKPIGIHLGPAQAIGRAPDFDACHGVVRHGIKGAIVDGQ